MGLLPGERGPLIVDVDERHKIEINDWNDDLRFTIRFRMDDGTWVIHGGCVLTRDSAASLGVCLIDRAGKDKEMLKAKFQRKDD